MAIIRLDNILPPFVSDWMEDEEIRKEYLKYARIDLDDDCIYSIQDLFLSIIIDFDDVEEDG